MGTDSNNPSASEGELFYSQMFAANRAVEMLIDPADGRIVDANRAAERFYGYTREQLLQMNISAINTLSADQIANEMARARELERDCFHFRHRLANGQIRDVEVHSGPLEVDGRTVLYSIVHDISERVQAEQELRIAETFFNTTSEAITVTDAQNRIIRVNPAFCQITGYSAEEVIGQNPNLLSSGRNSAAFYREMWRSLQRVGRWQGEIWNRRKNGELFPEWLSIVAIRDAQGQVQQYMAIFSDITKRKQDEEKIWLQANYDSLTHLPNRNLFKDRLLQTMESAKRGGQRMALLFVDLDRFKWVNDTLGHAVGDMLLYEVAGRLQNIVRRNDTVARLSGDEFTVILGEVRDHYDVDRIAEKLIQHIAEPYNLEGHQVFTSASVGITLYPNDGDGIEQLLRNADAAMYSAKEAGRNVFRYFTQQMNEEAQRRLMLEAELRQVMARGELEVWYQPIVDAAGVACGAEALLRWPHPQHGFIPPDEFVHLAEEIGLITEIERWVMLTACHDTVGLCEMLGEDFFVTVNISSVQCKSDQCWHVLGSVLEKSGLPAHCLKLEITERAMMENTTQVIELLKGVREIGVGLAIDDFGTGYSSLSYLKQFPINVLKIDRSFVDGLPDDGDDVALVEAIILMSHSLKLQVVAEGVETEAQQQFLRERGCDLYQGYYYAKPLPLEQLKAYLTDKD